MQWCSQRLKHTKAHVSLIIIYPYIFQSFYCHVHQSKTIQYLYSLQIAIFCFSRAIQQASNGKSSLHYIYKDEYSNDFVYAVIRLIKITARNENALTARGTKCKYIIWAKANFTQVKVNFTWARPGLARLWLRQRQKVRLLCRLQTNIWLLTRMFSLLLSLKLEAIKSPYCRNKELLQGYTSSQGTTYRAGTVTRLRDLN